MILIVVLHYVPAWRIEIDGELSHAKNCFDVRSYVLEGGTER